MPQCSLISGGSRGGARRDCPPLILSQKEKMTEGKRLAKQVNQDPPPPPNGAFSMPQYSLISGGSKGGARGPGPALFWEKLRPSSSPPLSSRSGSATVNEHSQAPFLFQN